MSVFLLKLYKNSIEYYGLIEFVFSFRLGPNLGVARNHLITYHIVWCELVLGAWLRPRLAVNVLPARYSTGYQDTNHQAYMPPNSRCA